jgi:hypothetical protein
MGVAGGGCAFGPRALESSHGHYNAAVKQVAEQQLLLNLLRLRYDEALTEVDVQSIAAQYELTGQAEARPFFGTPNPAGSVFRTFPMILPDLMAGGSNRPTISLNPFSDDPGRIRNLLAPVSVDRLILLTETTWPVSTVFRLWVEYLNGIPNAVTASGPTREFVPEFQTFQRVVQLLQVLQDRSVAVVVTEERERELGSPVPAATVTASALVEAARNGFEYRRLPDGNNWVLVKRERKLVARIDPAAVASPEMLELCALLRLKPGLTRYELTVGPSEDPFRLRAPGELAERIHLVPRSTLQALFYLAHGIIVPPEHIRCGAARATVAPNGEVFDWQEVTRGLFTVHYARQHCCPKNAYVAVKYRGYWFYIDDADHDSKATFSFMLQLNRLDIHSSGQRRAGPVLTLPIGR